MKTKKSKRANLENFRTIFLQIGIILTLTAILAAFEWETKVEFKPITLYTSGTETIELNMPITRPKEEKKLIKPPVPISKIIIEKNDVKIEDEQLFESTEFKWDDAIDINIIEDIEDEIIDPIFFSYQEYPKFMGKDDNAFRKYIAENVRFPIEAQENGLMGKVQVQFVVDLDGSLSQIKILRGVHPSIDKEVLRVIENSPKWLPAVQSGRNVRAMYGIIIAFKLEN